MAQQDIREERNEYFLTLNTIITDLLYDANCIIEHLTFIKEGILHSEITPINEIVTSLKEAQLHLPLGLHFPFRILESNWMEIEKCITVSAYYDELNIHTILKFPLISHPKYDILKVIPLPTPDHDNVFTLTEVDQPIIAIDNENQHYMTLTHDDLAIRCKQIELTYICENTNPVYHDNTNSLCEIQMYVQNLNAKILCNTRYIRSNHTIWIALENQRVWLYSTACEQTITIDCKNREEYRTKIVRTGQVALYGDCKLTTEDMTVKTIGTIKSTTIQTRLPEYNVTRII
ncbi:hypothetical protein ALC57_17578 [Trachymyrmex cornetzi]|uniref:Envelope fusion protein n=1 Tax=Trachymyrmex cornetzi TaxID=471704 RepID=A0A151ITK6_9HYME|nr:hypothetical protein ALC57_17578 [Trachymyrmex cornetzi]